MGLPPGEEGNNSGPADERRPLEIAPRPGGPAHSSRSSEPTERTHLDDPTCPRCGHQGPPARRYEAQGLIKCGGCQELVEPRTGSGSAPGEPEDTLTSDLSWRATSQSLQVWALRLLGGSVAILLVIPTQLPPEEALLTSSWLLWGPVAAFAGLACAHLLSASEARVLELARRPSGARLKVGPEGLELPHIATLGPARSRALQAGQPVLRLAWDQIHAVVLTSGGEGIRSIRFELQAEEEAGALLAPDHVFLRCDALLEGQEERILQIASEHAGPRAPGETGPGTSVLRRGLSARQLETNQKLVLGVGVLATVGLVLAGFAEVLAPAEVAVPLVALGAVLGTTYWRIGLAASRARR